MRRRVAGVVSVVGLAGLVTVTVPAVAALAADEGPLQTAGRAAEQVAFDGTLRVRWFDGNGERSDLLSVQAANGSVVVRGGSAAMASLHQRLVEHAGGVWDLLWPSDQVGSGRPPADRKYQLVNGPATTVADRPANVVEVRQGGAVLERLALDQATGLLLRREQYEEGAAGTAGTPPAAPSRTIEFETITFGSGVAAPDAPRTVVNVAPKVVTAPKAAQVLDGGYQRVGTYKRSGVTQALYSDGLYDLSVFQQEGRLDRSHLPSGAAIDLSNSRGVGYAWAGGHVVVWATSGIVYTAVSDAPLDQVLAAARSLPLATGSVSLIRRLRQVCRSLLRPLA